MIVVAVFRSFLRWRFRNWVKRETERPGGTERDKQAERANPESHGNLATSAIGRTCTRSNLKSRSRTSPAILSFVRVIRVHVYPFIAFGYAGNVRIAEQQPTEERRTRKGDEGPDFVFICRLPSLY